MAREKYEIGNEAKKNVNICGFNFNFLNLSNCAL